MCTPSERRKTDETLYEIFSFSISIHKYEVYRSQSYVHKYTEEIDSILFLTALYFVTITDYHRRDGAMEDK